MSPGRRGRVREFPEPTRPRPLPPPPAPLAPPLRVALTPADGATRVIVAWRRALSSPLEEEEIDWPPGWRLPSAGDSVHLSGNRGGFVESIDFDIGRQAIRVNIR